VNAFLSAARAKKLDRIAAAYAVAGWLLVQAASIVLPTFGTPQWALRTIIAIAFVGFPVALFIAWFSIPHPHPDSISKAEGLTSGEYMLLALLGGVLLLSLAQLSYQFLAGARAPTAPTSTQSSLGATLPRAASAPAASLRVAIIPFDIVGASSDASRAFADTLLDKIIEVLVANQVDTVSRADSLSLRGESKASVALAALRVGMTLEGSVQNDGKTITVRLHLDDVQQHQTLWSREFQGPADSPEPLETTVALHATNITRCAVSPRLKGIRSDPSLVAEYLEGEDEDINGTGGGRVLAIARDLVSRAPRFAAAHTLLASALDREGGGGPATPEELLEAVREARIAIALDGGDGQAYAIISTILPAVPFKKREELLLKGLAIEPGSASANFDYIFFLLSAGRLDDAIAQGRAAWQFVPFTEWVASCLPMALATAGRLDEARDAIAEMNRKWPQSSDPGFKSAEFFVETQKPPFTRALALLDDPDLQRFYERGSPGQVKVWRAAIQGHIGSAQDKRIAVQTLEAAVNDGKIFAPFVIAALSALGDIDSAFRAADRNLASEKIQKMPGVGAQNYYPLFSTEAVEMRRDPRFMQLAQRLGLVDYWRSTGHWPDFCAEPGLPYDCKTVAAKLAAAAAPGARH